MAFNVLGRAGDMVWASFSVTTGQDGFLPKGLDSVMNRRGTGWTGWCFLLRSPPQGGGILSLGTLLDDPAHKMPYPWSLILANRLIHVFYTWDKT